MLDNIYIGSGLGSGLGLGLVVRVGVRVYQVGHFTAHLFDRFEHTIIKITLVRIRVKTMVGG